jgi:hypothetical protein
VLVFIPLLTLRRRVSDSIVSVVPATALSVRLAGAFSETATVIRQLLRHCGLAEVTLGDLLMHRCKHDGVSRQLLCLSLRRSLMSCLR